jgi:hypothetical protein
VLAAQLRDRRSKLRLPQNAGDLFDRKPLFFTTKPPSVRLDFAAELLFKLVQFYRGPSSVEAGQVHPSLFGTVWIIAALWAAVSMTNGVACRRRTPSF